MTETKAPILELKNIMKAYDANVALKNAGLTVLPGEIHALMGANGAGKSTMIKIIAGAHKPNEGEIILNGEQVTFNNPKDALRKGVAVVYQELSLVPHLTVSENIAMGVDSVTKKGRYDWAESDRVAAAALARLGKGGEGLGLGSWDHTQLVRGHWDGAGRRAQGLTHTGETSSHSGPGGWEVAWLPFFPLRTQRQGVFRAPGLIPSLGF